MRLFHGTTADALPSILRDGFSRDNGGENWTVSGDYVYFWSPKELVESGECEDESSLECAHGRAFDSAQFGLGFAKDCRAVVFEVELPEGGLEQDTSCPNMAGAVRVAYNVPPSAIVSINVSDDLSLLKGFFLSFTLNRQLSARELSPIEAKIAEKMSGAEFYPEDIEEIANFHKM